MQACPRQSLVCGATWTEHAVRSCTGAAPALHPCCHSPFPRLPHTQMYVRQKRTPHWQTFHIPNSQRLQSECKEACSTCDVRVRADDSGAFDSAAYDLLLAMPRQKKQQNEVYVSELMHRSSIIQIARGGSGHAVWHGQYCSHQRSA
jgi:hypothetical protein